jgi:hypothetical protein
LKSGHTRSTRRRLNVIDYSATPLRPPASFPEMSHYRKAIRGQGDFSSPNTRTASKVSIAGKVVKPCSESATGSRIPIQDIYGSLCPLPYHDINYYVKMFLGRVRSPAPGFKASVKSLVAVGRVTHHQINDKRNCVPVARKWATASPPFGPGSRPLKLPSAGVLKGG